MVREDDARRERAVNQWIEAVGETATGSRRRKMRYLGVQEVVYWALSILLFVLPFSLLLYNKWDNWIEANAVVAVIILLSSGFGVYHLTIGIMYERPAELACYLASFGMICVVFTCNLHFYYEFKQMIECITVWVVCVLWSVFGINLIRRYRKSMKYVIRVIFDRFDVKPEVRMAYRCFALAILDLQASILLLITMVFNELWVWETIIFFFLIALTAIMVPLLAILTVYYEGVCIMMSCLFTCLLTPIVSLACILQYVYLNELRNMNLIIMIADIHMPVTFAIQGIELLVRGALMYTVFFVGWRGGQGVNIMIFPHRARKYSGQSDEVTTQNATYNTFNVPSVSPPMSKASAKSTKDSDDSLT